MPERHASLRRRIQKGDPLAAFEREIALLEAFRARGAAVPEIVARDADRVILTDQGKSLHDLLVKGEARQEALAGAGVALADLHCRDLAHGRPSLRDICWDGKQITFLDLEAGAQLQAQTKHKARDLFLLLLSAIVVDRAAPKASMHLLETYLAECDPTVWTQTVTLARKLWWLQVLAAPFAWRDKRRGKPASEFAALAVTRSLILNKAQAMLKARLG